MEVKERDCVKWMHFPVYAGLSPLWINQVKSGLNAAAWLNGRIQKFDHISTRIWDELLWWRHEFKILLLIHNSLTSCALGNYRELCISLALDLFALQYKMFWLSLCTVVLQCNGVGPSLLWNRLPYNLCNMNFLPFLYLCFEDNSIVILCYKVRSTSVVFLKKRCYINVRLQFGC